MRGAIDIVKTLVYTKANPNAQDFDQNTPLHFASENGKIETISFLLNEAKADAYIKNKFGYYPNDIALNIDTRKAIESSAGSK